MKALSYSLNGKTWRIRTRKRKAGAKRLTKSQRVRLSIALRRWARLNKYRYRRSPMKGRRLSAQTKARISRGVRRAKRS